MKAKSLSWILTGLTILCLSACIKHSSAVTSLPYDGQPALNQTEQYNSTLATPEQPTSAQAKEEAYLKADRNPPRVKELKHRCIKQADGTEVCGFDCKTLGNVTKCAEQPKARCIIGNNNEIDCGFDCKTTATHTKCGRHLYDNCVTDAAGNIKCGNNCQIRDDGQLICGK